MRMLAPVLLLFGDESSPGIVGTMTNASLFAIFLLCAVANVGGVTVNPIRKVVTTFWLKRYIFLAPPLARLDEPYRC